MSAASDFAVEHGFSINRDYKSNIMLQRVKRGPSKLVGKWLALTDADDTMEPPQGMNDEVLLAVYEHCEAEGGPAFEGGECGRNGLLSEHLYPNVRVAMRELDKLLGR